MDPTKQINSEPKVKEHQQQQQQQQINKGLYKTELCETFTTKGFCKYGNKCQFAHGLQELKLKRPQIISEQSHALTGISLVTAHTVRDVASNMVTTEIFKFIKKQAPILQTLMEVMHQKEN